VSIPGAVDRLPARCDCAKPADAFIVTVGDTVWTIGRQGSALTREATTVGTIVLRNVALTATAFDRLQDDAEEPARLLRYAEQNLGLDITYEDYEPG